MRKINKFAGICVVLAAANASAVTIEYSKLREVRLPYGEAVTISGALDDVTLPVRENGKLVQKKLSEVMEVTGVGLNYLGELAEPADAAGRVAGNRWSVTTKKLPQGKQAGLVFRFSGTINDAMIGGVLDAVVADPKFKEALERARSVAGSRDSLVQLNAMKLFLEEVAPLVRKNYSEALTLKTKEPPVALLASLANLGTNFRDLLTAPAVPGVAETDSFAAARTKVGEFFKAAGQAAVPAPDPSRQTPAQYKAAVYAESYQRLLAALRTELAVSLGFTREETETADVKDFEKYAGLDYGALYIPRMQALRHFATVNIYFGPVEDEPVSAPGNWKWIQQRVSLSFGFSLGDISSQKHSHIKADNAFVYGLGFRLNKYFRIVAGAAAFRDARSDGIRHGLMIGPSVDLTAFKYIRGIFGKGE